VVLKNDWQSMGGRDVACAFAVSRETLQKKGAYSFGGIGLAWNQSTKTYDLVSDGYLGSAGKLVNELKQEYSLAEVREKAFQQGYRLEESKLPDGSVQVRCFFGG
jgi:hypothetical protein